VVSKGSLTGAQRGQLAFDATIGLNHWSYIPASPIQAHLSVRQIQIADLQHLANVRYPVSGDLAAKISLNGSQLDPRGSGSIEISNARAYDEPLKNFSVTFHGDKGSIVSELKASADAGSANAKLSYAPRTKAYKLQVDAPAIILQKLRTVQQKNLALQGTVTISASGQGTLDDPQLTASIQLPKLEVKQNSIAGVKADLRVADKRAVSDVFQRRAQWFFGTDGSARLAERAVEEQGRA
jgi:translocation and assembly module TamB